MKAKTGPYTLLSLIRRIGQGIARHYDRQLSCIVQSRSAGIEQALRQARERAGVRAWNGKEA